MLFRLVESYLLSPIGQCGLSGVDINRCYAIVSIIIVYSKLTLIWISNHPDYSYCSRIQSAIHAWRYYLKWTHVCDYWTLQRSSTLPSLNHSLDYILHFLSLLCCRIMLVCNSQNMFRMLDSTSSATGQYSWRVIIMLCTKRTFVFESWPFVYLFICCCYLLSSISPPSCRSIYWIGIVVLDI